MLASKNFQGLSLIILAAVVGAASTPFAKFALREMSPLSFTLLRFVIASLIIIPVLIFQKFKIRASEVKILVFVSLLSTANTMLSIFGTQRTTADIVQMMYTAVPLVAALFAYLLLRDRLSARKLLGLVVGLVGMMILILLPVIQAHSAFSGDLKGNLIILTAILCFSLYVVLSKPLHQKYSSFLLMAVYVLTTTAVQLILLPFTKQYVDMRTLSHGAWLAILYSSIAGTVGYYVIYQYAIKNTGPVAASTILYLQPAFTAVWAFFLLGEQLTWGLVLGGLISLLGVTVAATPNRSKIG